MTPLPHQTEAIDWLVSRTGALLGDQPGLGKTLVAILAAKNLIDAARIRSALVVCPKTLIHTWLSECELWWPGCAAIIYGEDHSLFIDKPQLTILHYDRLASFSDTKIAELEYDLLIADEIQRAKNRESITARCMHMLRIPRRWGLTGTPLENSLTDLMSIFEILLPDPIESDGYEWRPNPEWTRLNGTPQPGTPLAIKTPVKIKTHLPSLIANSYLSEIPGIIAPYFIRRSLKDVIKTLPDYTVQDIHLDLTDGQQREYDKIAATASGLSGHTKLQQICNFDPETGTGAKTDRLLSDLEAIVATGNKALVFSQFREEFGLKRLHKIIPGSTMLHGEVPNDERKRIVGRFNRGAIPVLLIHYRVGGIGLNLQAARYVYLFDRCWNPAIEEQAIRRAFRMGQDCGLLVRRFLCRNTIETDVNDTMQCKQLLAQSVLRDICF